LNINVNDEKYKIALSEVDDILYFTDDSVKSQIPNSFLNFIKKNKHINYISNINPYLEIEEQNISEEAKSIMALIYRSYIATENEKAEYQKKDKEELSQIEAEKKEKYNPDAIFKSNYQSPKEDIIENSVESTALIVTNKNGIIEKIKSFFKKIFNNK